MHNTLPAYNGLSCSFLFPKSFKAKKPESLADSGLIGMISGYFSSRNFL